MQAQCATGGIICPKNGKRYRVGEAYIQGLVPREFIQPLERAEKAVLGFIKKEAGRTLNLLEARKAHLVSTKETQRFIQAQLATGGIVIPKKFFRIGANKAMQEGIHDPDLVDEQMAIFTHPNSELGVSYQNLMKECQRMAAPKDRYATIVLLPVNVTNLQGEFISNVMSLKLTTSLDRKVTISDLKDAELIEDTTINSIENGKIGTGILEKMFKTFLIGDPAISGVLHNNESLSLYQAYDKGIMPQSMYVELLEAQIASTGLLTDPATGKMHEVKEGIKLGLVDEINAESLSRAKKAIIGHIDPLSGKLCSLFQAIREGYVAEGRALKLLEAQLATGGIIDTNLGLRVPISKAVERGLCDQRLLMKFKDSSRSGDGKYSDPNTGENNLTYLDLIKRTVTDRENNTVLFVINSKNEVKEVKGQSKRRKQRKRKIVVVDSNTGEEISIKLAFERGIIDKTVYEELEKQQGLNSKSSSAVGDISTGAQMSAGITAEELKDRLKRLQIDGKSPVINGCLDIGISGGIGGNLMQGITVAESLKRTLLDNTTALRLLEAQACTGGLIDSEGNRCDLQTAVKKGLIDQKQINRLIDAERAYAGFNCDRSGKRLSVAEALKKGMITYDMGTRLMEYQIATGGLINPNTKSRVDVEEAVKIGWIDQKRANRLADFSRSTRQIVSPTTGLLISYYDALMTSIPDKHNNLQLEALPKAERQLRVGNAQIKAYSCASSVVSSIAASSFGDFSSPGQTVNMGFF